MTSKQETKGYDSRRTGGQYSLYRVVLGLALLLKFGAAWLATAEAVDLLSISMFAMSLALVLSISLALGWLDWLCALGVLLAWTYMTVWQDWRVAPADWILVFLTLYHLIFSIAYPAPFGAWSSRGRADPSGQWHIPEIEVRVVWAILGSSLIYAAIVGPLIFGDASEIQAKHIWIGCLLFLLGLGCAFSTSMQRRVRPWVWSILLGCLVMGSVGLVILKHEEHARSLGPWMLLLFLFEPRWVKSRLAGERELLFYDGECGLCHRAARFLLSEDIDGRAFSMAPLQGPTFASSLPAEDRATLPDSIIIQTHDGRLLTNSSAIVHILLAMGGLWRIAGHLLAIIPRPLRDAGYRFIASIRKRIFAQPKSLCPMLPPHLAERFLP